MRVSLPPSASVFLLATWIALAACARSAPREAERGTPPSTSKPAQGTPLLALQALTSDSYYAIHDVKDGDVLNVRAQPGASQPVAYVLRPGDAPVIWTGTSGQVGTSRWWRVATPAGLGWVNAAFLTAASAPTQRRPKLICFGNEPFWGLTVGPDGETQCEASCEGPAGLRGRIEAQAAGRFQVTVIRAQGEPFLSGSVARETCSDGMSDFQHSWSAKFALQAGGSFEGCCRVEP